MVVDIRCVSIVLFRREKEKAELWQQKEKEAFEKSFKVSFNAID